MNSLDATWFDGRDSRPRPARISNPVAGTLRLECEGTVLEFAAAELQLSPRLGRMPRTLRLPGEGHLQVEDSPLLEQWLPTPSRIEAIADWLERRRTAALTAGAATVLGVVLFFQVGLPWMADALAPQIPRAIERAVGEQALALIDRMGLQPSRLPQQRQHDLKVQFFDLIQGLPRADDYKLDFRHAPGLGANAFALPDGQIIVTDQLVELSDGDDALLMAVLAHEAGHHEHHHGMRQALESSAVVVVAGFLFGDLSGTASLSVSVPVLLLESGYSRGKETEADAFAFRLLRERGQSPKAFAEIMRRLTRKHGGGGGDGPLTYLSTHPASEGRIRAAEDAAKDDPPPAADDAD